MRVLVMGTGALGGYYGGLLARAGHDVSFVARGSMLAHGQRHGLRVESDASGTFQLNATFTNAPAAVGPVDLVLFCVKSFDTESAAMQLRPCIGPDTAVLCLQNGIENEDIAGAVLGPEHILAGAARIEATVNEDGVVRQIGPNHRIDFGEWSDIRQGADGAPRTERLLDAFQSAGIDAHLAANMKLELWRKFIFLCPTAGLTAATDRTIGEVSTMPETMEVLERAVAEIYRLGRAEGIAFADSAVADTIAFISRLPFEMKSSLQRDLERGRRVEIDALSGAVVRRGLRFGVDTPVHQTLLACVTARARGRT